MVHVSADHRRAEHDEPHDRAEPGRGRVRAQAEDPVAAPMEERLAPGLGYPDDAEKQQVEAGEAGQETVELAEMVVDGVVRHQAGRPSLTWRGAPASCGRATLL